MINADDDPDAAFKDFKQRRENYMSVYDTVDDREGSYIKIIDNLTFIVHNARGYLPQKVRPCVIYVCPYFADTYHC